MHIFIMKFKDNNTIISLKNLNVLLNIIMCTLYINNKNLYKNILL